MVLHGQTVERVSPLPEPRLFAGLSRRNQGAPTRNRACQYVIGKSLTKRAHRTSGVQMSGVTTAFKLS